MTSITRNFPWFVKDLGVAIVGEVCHRLWWLEFALTKFVAEMLYISR